jgi:hypothetical protein
MEGIIEGLETRAYERHMSDTLSACCRALKPCIRIQLPPTHEEVHGKVKGYCHWFRWDFSERVKAFQRDFSLTSPRKKWYYYLLIKLMLTLNVNKIP